jgi:hypothetical protein
LNTAGRHARSKEPYDEVVAGISTVAVLNHPAGIGGGDVRAFLEEIRRCEEASMQQRNFGWSTVLTALLSGAAVIGLIVIGVKLLSAVIHGGVE